MKQTKRSSSHLCIFYECIQMNSSTRHVYGKKRQKYSNHVIQQHCRNLFFEIISGVACCFTNALLYFTTWIQIMMMNSFKSNKTACMPPVSHPYIVMCMHDVSLYSGKNVEYKIGKRCGRLRVMCTLSLVPKKSPKFIL